MPAIMADAVIRIARSRPPLPSSTASRTEAPSRRAFSANVTRRMAFATEIPIAMIAPMNDWTFSVVPVRSSMTSTPHMTAGTADKTATDNRNDWKFAASSRKITTIANRSPVRRPDNVSSNAGTWPRVSTLTPRGAAPARAIACRISAAIGPNGFP